VRTREGLTLQQVLAAEAAQRYARWLRAQLAALWERGEPLPPEAYKIVCAARDELSAGAAAGTGRGAGRPRARNQAGKVVVPPQ
jgi:hypothetical protein